jgi:hypothetical protein
MQTTNQAKPGIVTCPGCGVVLANRKLGMQERYHASGECWQLCGELSAYHLSIPDTTFIHQLVTDVYGAQHSGGITKNITTAFSLIGLYLALEQGYSGWQVQQAHMELATQRKDWPRFEPPSQTGRLNVLDVLLADEGRERDERFQEWARDVWQSWQESHEWVKTTVSQMLRISLP